jgi:hypothetical protein
MNQIDRNDNTQVPDGVYVTGEKVMVRCVFYDREATVLGEAGRDVIVRLVKDGQELRVPASVVYRSNESS